MSSVCTSHLNEVTTVSVTVTLNNVWMIVSQCISRSWFFCVCVFFHITPVLFQRLCLKHSEDVLYSGDQTKACPGMFSVLMLCL